MVSQFLEEIGPIDDHKQLKTVIEEVDEEFNAELKSCELILDPIERENVSLELRLAHAYTKKTSIRLLFTALHQPLNLICMRCRIIKTYIHICFFVGFSLLYCFFLFLVFNILHVYMFSSPVFAMWWMWLVRGIP